MPIIKKAKPRIAISLRVNIYRHKVMNFAGNSKEFPEGLVAMPSITSVVIAASNSAV
jgi:hypothetical protein